MTNLDFVRKLINGKNCYSDHMGAAEIELLHMKSYVEKIVDDLLSLDKIVFLTGNPGDGKTYIIKSLNEKIASERVYCETDLNNIVDYSRIAFKLIDCFANKKPAIIAVNEYPFMQLLKCIKDQSVEMYDEIQRVRKDIIAYKVSGPLNSQIAVIDLNERNLLGQDYGLLSDLYDRMLDSLQQENQQDDTIKYNLVALMNPMIKQQLLSLFNLVTAECFRFGARDIVGALAFVITAGITDEYEGDRYYTALFEGNNDLLKAIQQFDPIKLTVPQLDEQLWNGEIKDGWIIEVPEVFPKDYDDVNGAVEAFKEIKRRYYFENKDGLELYRLQPSEVKDSIELFIKIDTQRRKIKESIIQCLNKLFLPSSADKKRLHIWTTHRFDMSIKPAVAISSRYVDSSSLELLAPRPADWLRGLEYIPDHVVLKPVNSEEPRLTLDIDFLRTLHAIDKGYPVALLAPQYEQAVAMFLQQLDNTDYAEENDDGETIIASRNYSFQQIVYISNGQYGFGEDEK